MRGKKSEFDDFGDRKVSKPPMQMNLNELRSFLKDEAARMRGLSEFDDNAKWVLKWLEMPIKEFDALWRQVKQRNLNSLEAQREMYRLTGAYVKQAGNYDDAIVVPSGWNGPLMAHVTDWRFHEWGLIEYAKKKDDERLAATLDTKGIAESKKVTADEVPF